MCLNKSYSCIKYSRICLLPAAGCLTGCYDGAQGCERCRRAAAAHGGVQLWGCRGPGECGTPAPALPCTERLGPSLQGWLITIIVLLLVLSPLPLCCCRRFFVSAALAIIHVTNQVCYLGALLQQLKLNKATEKDCMNFSERLQP